MKQLILFILIFMTCKIFANNEYQGVISKNDFDEFQKYLIKIESRYTDQALKRPVTISGLGTLIQVEDLKQQLHWVVITASHVSQGENDIKLYLANSLQELKIIKHPTTGSSWRLANNSLDLEAFVVEVPGELQKLSRERERSLASGLPMMKISFFPKLFLNLPEIFFTATPHPEKSSIIKLSQKAYIPSPPVNEKGSVKFTPQATMKSAIDPSVFHSLLFPWAAGYGYRNWQWDNILHGSVKAGYSGLPVFEVGKPRLTAIVRGFHRFMPKTYTIDASLIRILIKELIEMKYPTQYTDSTRWNMMNGETYRTFGDKQEYSEINPLLSFSDSSYYHNIKNSGGHSTGDVGETKKTVKSSALSIVSPGLTKKTTQGYENILAYQLGSGTVYAEWESKKWIESLAKEKNGIVTEIPYPPDAKEMYELSRQRAKKSSEFFAIEKKYFEDFWSQNASKISWVFEQMFGGERNSYKFVQKAISPYCKVIKNQSKNNSLMLEIRVPSKLTHEGVSDEEELLKIEVNHLGQNALNNSSAPYSVISAKTRSGKNVLVDPNGLFFLDFKQVDRMTLLKKTPGQDELAWPFNASLLTATQWFESEKYSRPEVIYFPQSQSHTPQVTQRDNAGLVISKLGNFYFEGAYIVLKTESDDSGWPITCVEDAETPEP